MSWFMYTHWVGLPSLSSQPRLHHVFHRYLNPCSAFRLPLSQLSHPSFMSCLRITISAPLCRSRDAARLQTDISRLTGDESAPPVELKLAAPFIGTGTCLCLTWRRARPSVNTQYNLEVLEYTHTVTIVSDTSVNVSVRLPVAIHLSHPLGHSFFPILSSSFHKIQRRQTLHRAAVGSS